jgi:hypothetical protein
MLHDKDYIKKGLINQLLIKIIYAGDGEKSFGSISDT